MFEQVVQNVELPDLDGNNYRNFEECLVRRLGNREAALRPGDKQIIKEAWKKEVKAHYQSLQQRRKLIQLGTTGRLVLAAPVGPDVAILERALEEWRRQMQTALDAAFAQPEAPAEASSEEDE